MIAWALELLVYRHLVPVGFCAGVVQSMLGLEGVGEAVVWGTKQKLNMKGAVFMNAYSAALFDMDIV